MAGPGHNPADYAQYFASGTPGQGAPTTGQIGSVFSNAGAGSAAVGGNASEPSSYAAPKSQLFAPPPGSGLDSWQAQRPNAMTPVPQIANPAAVAPAAPASGLSRMMDAFGGWGKAIVGGLVKDSAMAQEGLDLLRGKSPQKPGMGGPATYADPQALQAMAWGMPYQPQSAPADNRIAAMMAGGRR